MTGRDVSILVVDDNDDNRFTLVQRLKREGYTNVTVAENGRIALDSLSQHEFDLVLLDIMMPEISGYEVLERMRESEELRSIPVIMVSAVDEFESVVRCIEAGAEDYLQKPFNAVLLRARIHACLEKKRLRDEIVRQLRVIRQVFGKYVPQSLVDAIVAGEGVLTPRQVTATVLYTDIESFSTIAEAMSPENVVTMLNEYFPAVIEPIERHGGVVNQFQGDAMLVTFNVPVEDPIHADKALRVAQDIQKVVKERTFAGMNLRTRIGINTGEVIAGNVGSGDRINYTVHGDAVNLAARLEQLNKDYGSSVLVSETTVQLVEGSYPLDSIGTVPIRGKDSHVGVYSLAV